MARLPHPGSDDNIWGDVLNEFLQVAHKTDGTLKADAISVPPANANTVGAIQLTGDLGGSATSPKVPALDDKADDQTVVHLAGAETIAGVKTFSSSPIVPTPTNDSDAASKTYVDSTAQEAANAIGDGVYFLWQGAWETSHQYAINDCVNYQGSGYICIAAHTSGTFATDLASVYWSLFVQKGDTGATGAKGDPGPLSGSANIAYGTSLTPPSNADDGTLYITYAA